MSGLKGSLIELMADISKVKADEKVLADVEKKEFSEDYDNICRKCDELKHVFPIGFEVIRKRYAKKVHWCRNMRRAPRLKRAFSGQETG
jgi:hypothetical protein